ncbi:phosphatase PAP2 family protein [Lactobacillus terrae]|uniref:phosphatase PAP2 family protein n=1 Tax=Lactobacillus terrae TaxID=2269374 RepID=UPI000C1B6C42|nr:phosphatase PAP2 family protein [Lactobacillus terrae]
MKNKTLAIIDVVLNIILIDWIYNVVNNSSFIRNFDNSIINYLYDPSQGIVQFCQVITHLGDELTVTILVTITVIVLFILKRYYSALFIALNEIVATGINSILKHIFTRARPVHHHFVDASGFSFPSGHSVGMMTFMLSIIILTLYISKKISTKIIVSIICTIVIILIGLSRIILGVHYPSDVFGGYLLGLVTVCTSLLIFRSKDSSIFKLEGIQD